MMSVLAGGHSNPSSQRLMHKKIAMLKRGDFRFGPLNVFLLVVLFVAGLIVHLNSYEVTVDAVLFAICSAIARANSIA